MDNYGQDIIIMDMVRTWISSGHIDSIVRPWT